MNLPPSESQRPGCRGRGFSGDPVPQGWEASFPAPPRDLDASPPPPLGGAVTSRLSPKLEKQQAIFFTFEDKKQNLE